MLAHYELVAPMGQGASGTVWKVRDIRTNATCALKVGIDSAALEFSHLAGLAHTVTPGSPGGVAAPDQLFDGVALDTPCFDVALDRRRPSFDARTWDAASACSASRPISPADWQRSTTHGLVHGDVAPQNVLTSIDATGRTPCSIDLGFAGRIDSVGAARGTPAYMAPEALAGHALPGGDLWGLGVVLVRLATGEAPFGDGAIGEVAHRAMTAARPVVPELGAALADLVRRLLAVDPDARPSSATRGRRRARRTSPPPGAHAARRCRRPAAGGVGPARRRGSTTLSGGARRRRRWRSSSATLHPARPKPVATAVRRCAAGRRAWQPARTPARSPGSLDDVAAAAARRREDAGERGFAWSWPVRRGRRADG